ncbi:MAG: MbtH family NRPS accessory protein [Oceanicaulis sp.]|nr:MbtH family NRPS accessory protein [Oceanicaulis sp.]
MTDEVRPFDEGELVVVVNAEGQYSIWPSGRTVPAGWTPAGFRGSRQECLSYIETVWTDITPASLKGRGPG